jgi:hypothetical protein
MTTPAAADKAGGENPSTVLRAAGRLLAWAAIACGALLVAALAWRVAGGSLYTAGSRLGYNLGLAGGLMLLVLLLYPLRKRSRLMERMGSMRHWFRLHMMCGIGGPLLILFHSTFRTGSPNARVALYSMLLVMCSGLVGRFVYRHVHRGLYGSRLTQAEAEEALRTSSADLRAALGWMPSFERKIQAFRDRAFAPASGFAAILRFVSLRWRGGFLSRSLRREIRRSLRQRVATRCGSNAESQAHWLAIVRQLDAYIDATCTASQFAIWDWLFSLWRVVHIPFLYLLLVSGIAHVVAVHMY